MDGATGLLPVQKIGELGRGGFGMVYLVKAINGQQLAQKDIPVPPHGNVLDLLQEVKLLKSLDHVHIMKCIHAYLEYTPCLSGTQITLCILTEYYVNGDLAGYLKKNAGQLLDERWLVEWIRQIAQALEYLHGNNVIHRDVKPANVLLDQNWNTKLGDFGIARVLVSPEALAQTFAGTPQYISPEIRMGIRYSGKTDIFSLGIMMYEMSMNYRTSGMPPMPIPYSSGVTGLMSSMMKIDQDERPSAQQVLMCYIFQTTPKPVPLGFVVASQQQGLQPNHIATVQATMTCRLSYRLPYRLPAPHQMMTYVPNYA